MRERKTFFSWKAERYTYLQGKKLLSSKGNGQCFINDLLLHTANTSVVGGGWGLSYLPRSQMLNIEHRLPSLHPMEG